MLRGAGLLKHTAGHFKFRFTSFAISREFRTLLLAVLLCFFAVGARSAPGGAERTIVLPYLMGLTGGAAVLGQAVKIGAELAQKTVNENGGIKSLGGAKIKVEIVNHQSKQDVAFNKVRDLARNQQIPLVMGAASSGATITATEAAERARLPFLVDGSDDDEITNRGFKYLVNLSMPMSHVAAATLEGLRDLSNKYEWKLKNIAILVHDDPPGPTTLKGLVSAAPKYGFNIIATLRYPESTTDFTPIITKLRALRPDITIQQSYPSSALLITKTMAEQDYNPPAVVGIMAGHSLNSYGSELGKNADGTIFTTYWSPDLKLAGAQDFVRRYHAAGYHGLPGAFIAFGYRAVIAASYILEAAKSTDREKVLKTMKSLDVKQGEWPLYPFAGGIKFNSKGENVRDRVIIDEWIDGKQKSIWPLDVAGAKPVWPKPHWQ